MLKYLPSCKHLTHLDLDGNKVGKAAMHIAKTIENMGLDPPLELLYLRNCSIPGDICGDILKYLSQCKLLTSFGSRWTRLKQSGKTSHRNYEELWVYFITETVCILETVQYQRKIAQKC